MTNATEALLPPPPEASPQAHFQALRTWVAEHCLDPHAVRRSPYQMFVTHLCHCFMKFGPDERLNGLTSRDLMCLLIYTNGPVAEYVMRTAYFRSIIEGEHEIYEHINTTLFIPECRAWYWTIAEAMLARAPDPDGVTTWLEGMTGEEKATARLIISRVYPDTAHIDWLLEVTDTEKPPMARLAAELALILMQKKSYGGIVKTYLREHPHVRYAVGEEKWGKL